MVGYSFAENPHESYFVNSSSEAITFLTDRCVRAPRSDHQSNTRLGLEKSSPLSWGAVGLDFPWFIKALCLSICIHACTIIMVCSLLRYSPAPFFPSSTQCSHRSWLNLSNVAVLLDTHYRNYYSVLSPLFSVLLIIHFNNLINNIIIIYCTAYIHIVYILSCHEMIYAFGPRQAEFKAAFKHGKWDVLGGETHLRRLC